MRMKAKSVWLLVALLLVCLYGRSQNATEGYIISIEKDAVYIDLNKTQVAPGDLFDAYRVGGYMTHPVTGKRIRKNDVLIGLLEVGETYAEYSVARPQNPTLIKQLEAGMKIVPHVQRPATTPERTGNVDTADGDRVPIVIAPAVVNDVVNNGHFGGYVADILMEQMLQCDKVRLLDRSVLNAQMSEIDLAGDVLDPATTIQRGQAIGARYVLQTTMQKPDVANIKTGVPLAAVMGAVQMATGTNIGAAYASNMQIAQLKAAVVISVRVVDQQTGEVVFMASGEGEAKGKSQVAMEYGALGGGQLNGGVEGFKQTVTGKAIQQAFRRIGRNLISFFNGKTDKKVAGSLSGGFTPDAKMYSRGYRLYMGTEKLDKEGLSIAFADTPDLYFQYKKAKRNRVWGCVLPLFGIGFAMGVGTPVICNSDNMTATGIAFGMAGLGAIAGGIVLYCNGQNKVKKVANRYNALTSSTSYYRPTKRKREASLALAPNGLRITF